MVATDINHLFDTYVIAGSKMKEKLTIPSVDTTDEDRQNTSSDTVPPPKIKLQIPSNFYVLDHQDWDAGGRI